MLEQIARRLAISDLLSRFFQAFDDKNWEMMRAIVLVKTAVPERVVVGCRLQADGAFRTVARKTGPLAIKRQARSRTRPPDRLENVARLRR